ncbi:tetratricopeptide repeat-containing sensor histidine kinase [Dyadobacter luticola]|uniref:histidine kinase n=1 Tax=Dyadobacter luticola TaxID=1979387 RepID=A0A5R9L4D1_9BACT|nr:histidine kinase dimerization/phosphoacceptor domain -containing protein [Dyadobacter luticola]TLV03444.1 hypothetical protein FEN17_07515 [Dyadobacter luticola]
MLKTLALLSTFLLSGICASAEYLGPFTPKDTAPILARFKKSRPDTSRVMLAIQLSDQYYYRAGRTDTDLKYALFYTTTAQKLANGLHFEKGLAQVYFQQGAIFATLDRRPEGKAAINKAIILFTKQHDYRMLGETYFRLASYLSLTETEIQERIKYTNLSLEAFRKAQLPAKEAAVLEALGELYYIDGNNEAALPTLKQSLRTYQSAKHNRLMGIYDLLGALYTELGSPYEGIKYEMLALRNAKELEDSSLYLATIYNRIGMTHFELFDYRKAVDNYSNALNIANNYKDISTIQIVSTNLAHAYLKLKDGYKALRILDDLERKYASDDIDYKFWVYRIYVDTYRYLGQQAKAVKYIDTIAEMAEKPSPSTEFSEKIYHFLTEFYMTTGDFAKAEKYVRLHKAIADRRKYTQMTYLNLLWQSKLDSVSRQYLPALAHYQQYSAIRDSVFNQAKSRQINQLEIIYETEKKEENIALLKKESALQQNMLQQASLNQDITYVSIALLLIIIGLLFYGYRLVRKNNKAMAARQEEINTKNISLGRLLTEKEWLMKEIHHRVKNNLHMIVGLLESQSEYLKGDEAKMALAESEHRIQSMSMIHQKLYQTDNLSSIEISPYIHELVQYLKDSFESKCPVTFHLDIDRLEMNISHSIPLGLILNEAIINSLKYAFPDCSTGRIDVLFKEMKPGRFMLTISDNGTGLAPNFNVNKINSFGLTLIKGLCEELDGQLEIINNNGTTIQVSFDYISEEKQVAQYAMI